MPFPFPARGVLWHVFLPDEPAPPSSAHFYFLYHHSSRPPRPPPSPRRHYTHSRGVTNRPNPAGVRVEGWTGMTVYPYLFPEPARFLGYLRRRGVAVTFNHHPAGGVEFHEDAYEPFALALGRDPASGETIEFDVANAPWMDAYFKHVIKPIDDLGMQYWWLDFQQQPFTSVPLLNPTIMCNWAWSTNPHRYGASAPPEKAADRPFVMGRFGGLGAHRYPIGFVGDTYVKWEVLRYETYFMPTASNVGYQWTHDIGGFEGPSPAEFFTRHLQFGTFSPVSGGHWMFVLHGCVCAHRLRRRRRTMVAAASGDSSGDARGATTTMTTNLRAISASDIINLSMWTTIHITIP